MNASYHYRATARWTDGRRGVVEGESLGQEAFAFTSPPEFGGPSGRWTPEHLFVAAVATCFTITFRAIAEFSKFQPLGLEVTAEGVLEKAEGGFQFTRVILRPALTIAQESDRERGLRLLEKTERSCLVSRSLKSQVTLEPTLRVANAVAAA